MNETADRQTIRQRFDRAAAGHDEHAQLYATIGERLLERLDGLNFSPQRIIDLGCGSGRQTLDLRNRFPDQTLLALDSSFEMLKLARQRRGRWRRRFELARADIDSLPIAESSHDLIHACLSLQWSANLYDTLCGIRRIMRPRGLLLFALPGPDTLIELRSAGISVDTGITLHAQELGDLLTRAGFQEPVLDTDWLKLEYAGSTQLFNDLDHLGIGYRLPNRAGPNAGTDHRQVSFEVLYASAWSPDEGQPIRSERGEEASVSVSSLGIRRRRS